LVKIAVELNAALKHRKEQGSPGITVPRTIARGDGWAVADVVCTCGPHDRPFEEQHRWYSVAVVLAGSFQYRSGLGRALLSPGSLMLGNHGQCFECGHEHGEGDRCVSFSYAPDYFERLVADAGARRHGVAFTAPRLPPLRPFASLVARVGASVVDPVDVSWDELVVTLAARAVRISAAVSSDGRRPVPNAEARVTRTIRRIDRHPDAVLTLENMARDAGLSPYHFLRTFQDVTGLTPHQYVLRARLREAAMRLLSEPRNILDIALDCGFGDVSNFNRAFRTEFGFSPRGYRRSA
jgi:AraC family transcriptional regulator